MKSEISFNAFDNHIESNVILSSAKINEFVHEQQITRRRF